jgi:Protein of unknown function (DUF3043)
VFRRGNDGTRGGTAQDSTGEQSPGDPQTTNSAESRRARPAAEAGKGRPTPKRSEAERGRRQGITGTPRPAGKGGSARGKESREDRLRRNEAMRRGEEWALPARDRGPVKALARDYVDSKRRISEYYMYVMIVVIIVLFVRAASVQLYAEPIALALIVFIIVDAFFLRQGLKRLIEQRLPGKSVRGVALYAVFRALQVRRFRVPPPRVSPGTKV